MIGARYTGLLLTAYDDAHLWEKALPSLMKTYGEFFLVCVDASPEEGKCERIFHEYQIPYTAHPGESLAKSLNAGIRMLARSGCKVVGWTHADVLYPQPEWLMNLVGFLLMYPNCLKAAPSPVGHIEGIHQGNMCPWVMRTCTVDRVVDEYGQLFDEGYLGIGGHEDWDLNARLIGYGGKVMLTSTSVVEHEGMGTRKLRDTVEDGGYNAVYYARKWGTSCPPV